MSTSRTPCVIVMALLLPLVAGCREDTTVSGSVTYDGRSVEKGYVTFFPVQDSGPTVGAEVVGGQYQIVNLAPGKKRVHVAAEPRVAEASKGAGSRLKLLTPDLPVGAEGNDQIVTIGEGSQTLDIRLEKPKSKR